jgi:hypothetical protein
MSKINKLASYLKSGKTVTPKQITSMFGLKNPTAAVHQLRSAGVCVYANPATLYDGTRTTKYRVGAPTKAMVQAAHQLGLLG